jgi:hypothetical protein
MLSDIKKYSDDQHKAASSADAASKFPTSLELHCLTFDVTESIQNRSSKSAVNRETCLSC